MVALIRLLVFLLHQPDLKAPDHMVAAIWSRYAGPHSGLILPHGIYAAKTISESAETILESAGTIFESAESIF